MTTTRIDSSAFITAQALDRATEYLDRALSYIGSAESVAPRREYVGAPEWQRALAEAVEAVEAARAVAIKGAGSAWHATVND